MLLETVRDMLAFGRGCKHEALTSKDREQYQFWGGYCSALERIEAIADTEGDRQEPTPLTEAWKQTADDLNMVRQVLNADLKIAQERVLTLELENQRLRKADTEGDASPKKENYIDDSL